MIDFHTHILPGIDDGSRNMEETCQLLKQEQEQGTGRVLATPHFYAGRESAGHFFEKRARAMEKVREMAEKESWIPQIRMAAEVLYFDGMGKADILPRLCMEGSRVLLLEMPFMQWTGGMYRDVEAAVEKLGLTVVVAHVERYYGYQKDRGVWEAIFDLPVHPQINAGSFRSAGAGSFLRRRKQSFVLKLMEETKGGVLLGSDCHNPVYRPVNLKAGREVIRKKLGEEALERTDRLGEELWEHAGE